MVYGGFRARPFVLCKKRMLLLKALEHELWPQKVVSTKGFFHPYV